ncbi:MAG: hypothetical protein RIF41_29435 [Polyangiaceae bacterium]
MTDLPWRVFRSPSSQWEVLPSFLVGEVLFVALALLALAHAWHQPDTERLRHLAVWVGALVAGTVNDWIFMLLPLVDNFWQAQATVMLSVRMPLYIPCVYVWFMYLPTVALWRVRRREGPWGSLGQSAAAGLAGIVVYAPYDIVGAKFLWWSWHDTDPPIASRILGAPIGSTIWVICFVASFSLLVTWMLDRDDDASLGTCAKAVALAAACSTVVMVAQMTALQQLDGGTPGPVGLVVVVVSYAAVAARGLRAIRVPRGTRWDRGLRMAAFIQFATLALIMAAFDPASHRSTGVHQAVGECYVKQADITGLTRDQFLCVGDYDEDFTFDCVGAPPVEGTRWYTICGRPHRAFGRWLVGVVGLGVLGIALFGWILGGSGLRETQDGDS